jgi:hypothetical protein
MAEPTNNAAPFVPQATAASQRMADSVFERLSAGGRGARAETAAGTAPKATGPTALPLQTVAPAQRTQRVRDLLATEPKERAPAAADPPSFPTVAASWEPPEVSRAGLRARDTAEAERPLWSVLPAVQVEPILSAVEQAMEKGALNPPEMPVVVPPSSTVRQAESPAGSAEPTLSRATIDASLRMLDALRAHASMHATAGDQRISLGDMTLIAFAEKKQQLAAALANEVPEPKDPDRPIGHLQHPKVNTNKNMLLQKVKEVAEEIFKKEEENEQMADVRWGNK